MKSGSALFNALFREIGYVGSSYEKLRLDGSSDFDLNIVLDIDILDRCLELDFSKTGFVDLVVRWQHRSIPANHKLYRYE